VRWLIERQRQDGSWDETDFTGTGFPRVFYLKYHYYRVYFPLMALARWAEATGEKWETTADSAAACKNGVNLEHPVLL
jgi:squalene cyclase